MDIEHRTLKMQDMQTREGEDGNPYLEGYFAVFGDVYEVWEGATESIEQGAFTNSISGDVRALFNHNDDLVLGRTSAGTLELKQDSHGLWGRIKINRNDSDAMNAYERVKRGDVTGCSFGFNIEREEADYRDDGTVHWTIKEVNPLFEVSPCVFPAYQATNIASRGKDLEQMRKRQKDAWRERAMKALKGETNGIKDIDAPQED